jgi:hypothetical protein
MHSDHPAQAQTALDRRRCCGPVLASRTKLPGRQAAIAQKFAQMSDVESTSAEEAYAEAFSANAESDTRE